MKDLNTFKRVISIILVSFMFTLNVFAEETYNASYRIDIDKEQGITVEETTLEGEIDNSSLEVTVIKKSGEDETVIYTGPLGEYEDGIWSFTDFSEIQFLVVFYWEGPDNEALYIIPTDKVENNLKNIISPDKTVSLMSEATTTSLDATFDFDAIFWNSSGYDEYIVENKNTLGVDLRIKNNSDSNETIQPYFALYENGRLLEAKMLSSQTVNAGNEVNYTESININGNKTENYTAKVFNWADGGLKPLSNSVAVSGNKADFYGNSIANAILVQDVAKEVKGTINTTNDVDYLEIIPDSTNTYSLKTFSTSNVKGTLYNSSGTALVSNSASIDYTLTANTSYYVKLSNSGTVGDYIFTISENQSSEAAAFDVYKFDVDVNVFKKSILEICDDLYFDDEALSKQMYSEFEDILDDDAKLHALPEFLADHPKDISNFDELLNDYYGTKYDSFEEIKQRYIALIDKYTEIDGIATAALSENGTEEIELMSEEDNTLVPLIGKFTNHAFRISSIGSTTIQPGDEIQQTAATPSLNVVGTTATTITYNVTFPISGQNGNVMYLVDFNTDSGLTSCENIYGNDKNRTSGQYTISGLEPGGIYVLNMMWSTDGEWIGGENSICRYVQLPNNTTENLSLFTGGRVTARMETSDKTLATSSDFNTWLDRMDDTYYAYKELTGYTPFNSKKIEMRSTRDNLNDYFDIVDGQNYYWVVYGYFDGTNVFKYGQAYYKGLMKRLQYDDWGWTTMHEMSHVFDSYRWEFDAETLAQLKSYYVMEQLDANVYDCNENESVLWYEGEEYYDYLKSNRFMQSYANSFGIGEYASEGFAALLIDIQKEIGWEPFKKTCRYFSSLSSSQVLYDEGEILKLFLTKLKDYSGEDVLDMISNRDTGIIEDWYGITLEYVEPIYPIVSGGGSSGGGSSQVTVDKGSYSTFQFTPTESANYYIYTSPYGGTGVSNDTYIEVYNNSSLSGTPLASNDDYDGGRFSKVSVAMTEGTTYYIKVRHYNNGQLHAELNITKNVPVVELSLEGYEDIRVASGEFALYSYTPTKSITHVFEVGNYNGGSTEYDTYIKLYGNESVTQRLGNHNNKIMVNLIAGHTYYLQFSGFLMRSSRGRISVREGQTIEFSKSSDSSFIYVNSPEYLTRIDIVDDPCHIEPLSEDYDVQDYLKIFEQENITGRNTMYETHTAWWGKEGEEEFYPLREFYMDIDMYNSTANPITVSIENLAYGVSYSVLQQYYNGGYDYEITIEPYSHVPIFSYLGAPLLCEEKDATAWARIPVILFDFTVNSGNITVSTIAAYNPQNLYLRNGTKNIVDATGAELDNGDVVIFIDDNGQPIWEGKKDDPRPNETDLYSKTKGIARDESAWIDAKIELAIDENTNLGSSIPLYLKDDYYTYGISNPKWSWMSSINPLNDAWSGVLFSLPNGLHNFKYHYGTNAEAWYFDFWHRDLRHININSTQSINDEVPSDIVDNAKLDMAAGVKNHFPDEYDPSTGENLGNAPDERSMSIGEWGATYHYTVTISNTTDVDRIAKIKMLSAENMIFGLKKQGEHNYITNYYPKIYSTTDEHETTAIVNIPANETITFEFVTLLGGGLAGLNHSIVIE